MSAAAQLLDTIVPLVRARLPRGVDGDDLDDFLDRYRPTLLVLLEQNLGPVLRRIEAANNSNFAPEDIPEHWTVAKRTAANVAAMTVAATLYAERRLPTRDERAVLAGYSGWGGLSIKKLYPDDSILIFIAPPDRETLKKRLEGRGSDAPDVIERRLDRADMETKMAEQYDHLVVNDDLQKAVAEVEMLIFG